MSNNKGFTLTELIVVIVILTGISMIAVSGISASLSRRDTKECEEQKELAINAAKIYFSLNSSETSVKIQKLKNKGYFNEVSKTNRLNDESSVSKNNDGTYTFNGNCMNWKN